MAVTKSAETHDKSTSRVCMCDSLNDGCSHDVSESFILLSESALGNYHLGPLSPIAVWAILGALRSPVSDVCCWVNLQLRRPGPATSDGINRENVEGWEGWEGRLTAKMLEGEEQRGRNWTQTLDIRPLQDNTRTWVGVWMSRDGVQNGKNRNYPK